MLVGLKNLVIHVFLAMYLVKSLRLRCLNVLILVLLLTVW
jgi:hypothetical protein